MGAGFKSAAKTIRNPGGSAGSLYNTVKGTLSMRQTCLKGQCHGIFDTFFKNSTWAHYEQEKLFFLHFRFREDIREKRVSACRD